MCPGEAGSVYAWVDWVVSRQVGRGLTRPDRWGITRCIGLAGDPIALYVFEWAG